MNSIEKTMAIYSGQHPGTPKLNCSQSVCAGFADRVGLDFETAVNVSRGLGGGVGSNGQTCGAVCGGAIILGFQPVAGQAELTTKNQAYERIREYFKRFEARMGATDCNDLLGIDYSTAEGRKEAQEKGLHALVCPHAVRIAAEILDEMLDRG